MRSCGVRSITVVLVVLVGSADADRLAPHATQRAMVGAWDVRAGATLTLAPFGKHSLKYVVRFRDLPSGGPRVFRGDALWIARDGAFEVPCRPRSQHGSFCRISLEGDQLRVRVYAKNYDDPRTGHLVESFLVGR